MGARYFNWAKGYPGVVAADVVADELEKIEEQHGELTREIVAAAAKPADHPLHPEIYRVGSTVAARKWYEEQAGLMMRSLHVVYEERPEIESRYLLTVERPYDGDRKKQYKPTDEALADPAMREEILARAIRELVVLRKRYAHLSELAIVFASVDKVAAKL